MAYLPDEYGGYSGGRKRFDILIPVLLLIVVGIVILGKTTTMFCGTPLLGGLFCGGQQVNIAVIGSFNPTGDPSGTETVGATWVKAPEMQNWLDGKYGAAYNVQYQVYTPESLEFLRENLLTDYDMIVLVGERQYTRMAKDAVENYLKSGGNVLLIGDAALVDPDDAAYTGWGKMGMPVKLVSHSVSGSTVETNTGVTYQALSAGIMLMIADKNHPIFEGFSKPTIDFSKFSSESTCKTALKVIQVNAQPGAHTIGFIKGTPATATTDEDEETEETEETDTTTSKTVYLPAIVEGQSMFSGKAVYFAFDPGCSVNMMLATIEYLSGKDLG